MLFNIFPFKGKTEQELFKKIKNQKLNFPSTIIIQKNLKKFIKDMLTFSEQERPDVNQVINSFYKI